MAIETALKEAAGHVKAAPLEVPERVEKLVGEVKRLEKELAQYADKAASAKAADVLAGMKEVNGVRFLAAEAMVDDPKKLRDFAVKVRDRLESGVLLVALKSPGRVNLVCMVTPDLTGRFQAGSIIREVAPLIGGGGGGKPDLAEAGGKNPDGLADAFAKFYTLGE